MIKLSTNNLSYCHRCDLNSIISKKETLHGIPIYRYRCRNGCGEGYVKPVTMTDLPELQDRRDQYRADKSRQVSLPL